jgi:hypothetical protein
MTEKSELELLKERADKMGITYNKNIGVEKLREKINKSLGIQEEETEPTESLSERNARLRKEATRLVRAKVVCMNPTKQGWEGEIIQAGNSVIGMVQEFVPFNAPNGWHISQIVLNALKERKCQIFVTERNERGIEESKSVEIDEFNVTELPPLTVEDIQRMKLNSANR